MWLPPGRVRVGIDRGAGNVLYFYLSNGYRRVHRSKNPVSYVIKINVLYCVSVRHSVRNWRWRA